MNKNIIKKLEWDDNTKIEHVYKVVSTAFVNLPVQGDWKAHIAITDESNYGYRATLWCMNGGVDLLGNSYCRNADSAKIKAEEWWIKFVGSFLI